MPSRVVAAAGRRLRVETDGFAALGTARPEAILLLCCARTRLDAGYAGRIRDLLSAGIDWGFLLRLAREHGLGPLLYRNLAAVAPEHVPPEVMQTLRAEHHANAAHSLLLLAETTNLLAALRAAGIEAVPLKGPATALLAYGDVALRDSVDIDLLVRPEDEAQAAVVLRAERYAPEHEVALTDVQRRAFLRLCQHERFIHAGHGTEVELHWRPAPLAYAPDPGRWDLWSRCRPVSYGGRQLMLPAPEDQLLLLCLHGYSHLFACLKWVSDIAELLQAGPVLDHGAALQEARRLGCLRPLLLGYLLAGDLLGAPIPLSVLRRARADGCVALLAAEVIARYCRWESLVFGLARQARDFRLHLLAAGGLRARLSFCLRRFAPHSKRDLEWLSLPAPLLPLYWVAGPVAAVRNARRRPAWDQ